MLIFKIQPSVAKVKLLKVEIRKILVNLYNAIFSLRNITSISAYIKLIYRLKIVLKYDIIYLWYVPQCVCCVYNLWACKSRRVPLLGFVRKPHDRLLIPRIVLNTSALKCAASALEPQAATIKYNNI